jgi:MFS family permease
MQTNATAVSKSPSVFQKILVLRGAVRELWVTYIIYNIDILAYGLMNSAVILWLSSDMGYSDSQAGFLIATWSTVMTLAVMAVGSLTDALGIKRTFILGYIFCLFARFFMTISTSKFIALGLGLFPLAIGLALLSPVMNAAIRRFSTTAQRSMAFSIYYTLMNVAFAIAGWMFDYIRNRMGEYGKITLFGGMQLSTYQVLFLWALLFTLIGLVVTRFSLRDGVEATDEGVIIHTKNEIENADAGSLQLLLDSSRKVLRNTIQIFSSLWREPNFYKFLAFLSIAVGVKLVFYHMHYTFPKYGIRELGEGAPIGRLYGFLNPVLIVLLTPFVGALTQHYSAYRMLAIGSLVSSLSVFILALPQSLFAPLANGPLGEFIAHTWLGIGSPTVSPLYVSITIFVFVFSIGEAIWSPRLYEYSAAIAPKGQEASYMALSSLPYFFAKFFVGMFSGMMLEKYCPAEGARNSEMLWFWVGLMAMITPIGMLLFSKQIRVQEAGRNTEPPVLSEQDV